MLRQPQLRLPRGSAPAHRLALVRFDARSRRAPACVRVRTPRSVSRVCAFLFFLVRNSTQHVPTRIPAIPVVGQVSEKTVILPVSTTRPNTGSDRFMHHRLSLFGRRFTGSGAADGCDGRFRRTGPRENLHLPRIHSDGALPAYRRRAWRSRPLEFWSMRRRVIGPLRTGGGLRLWEGLCVRTPD